MKIFEQLDNAYKKALQNFEPAPSDDQWHRLAVALKNEQKARRRKFVFLISSLLLIALTGLYLFVPDKNHSIIQTKNTEITPNGQSHQSSDKKAASTKINNIKEEPSNSPNIALYPYKKNNEKNQNQGFNEKKNIGITNKNEQDRRSETEKQLSPKTSYVAGTKIDLNDSYSLRTFGIRIQNTAPEPAIPPFFIQLSPPITNQAKTPKTTNLSKNDRSGLFFTLSAGYGKTNNNLLLVENAAKQHKDVNQIFTALNGNYNAKQIQAGVTYVPKKGPRVSFTGGIQYRALSHQYDLKYLYTDIPFKDVNGTILGYIKDTGSIMEFNLSGVNSLKFISLPVYFRAPLWFHKDNELFVGAGMQLQLTAGSRGYFFDLNTQETIKNMPSSFRKWNLGYTVGLGYSRRINRNTFFFTEIQGIGMPQIQKLDAGDFRSRMTGLNAQIGIKYKIK